MVPAPRAANDAPSWWLGPIQPLITPVFSFPNASLVRRRRRQQDERDEDDTAQPETIDHRCGEWTDQTEQRDVDCHCAEATARLQPNSLSRGTISRPGVARTPAVMSKTVNVTAATIHA
jgi:hypothetical protein